MNLLVGWRTYLFLCSTVILFSCRKGEKIEPKILNQIITENLTDVRGTYARPPLDSHRRVNVDKLITELKDLHANCYNWLIYTEHNEWEDLPNFLPKARAAGIKVWVTVVPPSETHLPVHCSEPFREDYIKWAEEIAKLSLVYDNLVAWSIDDFPAGENLRLFTPQYIKKMHSTMKGINPNLAFIPCVYYEYCTSQFGRDYNSFFDGILFPYYAVSTGKKNFTDYNTLSKEVGIFNLYFKNTPIIVDVYAGNVSFLKDTASPSYIYNLIKASFANANGATIYCHLDAVKTPENYQAVKSGFSR